MIRPAVVKCFNCFMSVPCLSCHDLNVSGYGVKCSGIGTVIQSAGLVAGEGFRSISVLTGGSQEEEYRVQPE